MDSIREAILQGFFEPGEKIDQDLIAQELNVSRTPIREALKALESEGFVEIRPHRGAFTTTVSQQDIHEIYEIRKLLEAEVVRQITATIPEASLDELDTCLGETRRRFEEGDRSAHYESDLCFHSTIIGHAKNSIFEEVLNSLNNRTIRVRRFALLQPGPHLKESFAEHCAILQAMRARDSEQASEAMRIHLERSALRIQKLVAQRPDNALGS
jgi:DNA-binding GntR family transcriptional regulator